MGEPTGEEQGVLVLIKLLETLLTPPHSGGVNKIEIVNKTALWAVLFSFETLFIDPPPTLRVGGGL
jgi:hypothetical protein